MVNRPVRNVAAAAASEVAPAPSMLPSSYVDDAAIPFHVTNWTTPSVPLPRFSDPVWRVEGLDPHPIGRSAADFSVMSPEWALIAREVIYWRMAGRDALRDTVSVGVLRRVGTQPRSSTVKGIYRALRTLERASEELGIGLPADWTESRTDALRAWVRENDPSAQTASVVSALHTLRAHLTVGGIRHDPLGGISIYKWAGARSPSEGLKGTSIDPAPFVALMTAALAYIEDYSQDILAAQQWRDSVEAGWERGDFPLRPTSLRRGDPGFAEGFRGPIRWEIEQFIREHGALPAYTTSVGGKGGRGEPAFMTLAALLNNPVLKASASGKDYVRQRIAEGVPLRYGMLPLPVTTVTLPDGSEVPWREEWCWTSINREVTALRDACALVIVAFTGMRAGEAVLLPRHGWRTRWFDHPAIKAPLIKNAEGEDRKWWATDVVIRACELLAQTAADGADYLMDTPHNWVPVVEENDSKTQINVSLSRFVAHLDRQESLHALAPLPIAYKWGKSSGEGVRVTPHQLRFTLASIGNTAELGDVALMSQFHHAKHTMTWGYMENGGRDKWLDVLTENRAAEGLEHVVDLIGGVWAGVDEPSGPAGRRFTATAKAVLNEADVPDYDPDVAGTTLTDQFVAAVRDQPTVLAFARAVAADLHLGVVNHCYDDPGRRLCGGTEPLLAACLPERCGNVLIDSDAQVDLFLDVAREAEQLLEQRRIPAAQRTLLTRRVRDIRRVVGDIEREDT